MKSIIIKTAFFSTLMAALCLAWGFLVEPRLLRVRHISQQAGLDKPIKIGLMSDIHIGGIHMSPKRVEKIVATMNAHSPDIIFVAGDYVNGHVKRDENSEAFNGIIDEGLQALSQLNAPMGVYAALGNHDSMYDKAYLMSALAENGLNVLVNKAQQYDGYCIVGIADADTDRGDRSTFNTCPKNATILALMHSPDSFKYLRSDTAFAVAGHTHGGQINLPILGRVATATKIGKPYAYGAQTYNTIPVFITAGLGTSILPARFRAPPEIVLITLSGTD